jgi:hypothetical protein
MPPVGELNLELFNTPEEFIKKWAIHPPDDIRAYQGTRLGAISTQEHAPANRPRLAGTTRGEEIELARVDAAHRIAYINLQRMARGGYTVTGNEGGDHIHFENSFNDPGGWVPVWFLPWNTKGAAIRLTIPTRTDANPGPKLFFTAAINGCSVFFQGTAQNPTIYHCGGDTGQGVDSMGGAEFWQEIMQEFIAFDAARGKNKGALAANEVNKTHYIKTPGVGKGLAKAPLRPGEGTSTPAAMAYRRWLKDENRNVLKIEQISPWACVLGVRTGDNWQFYLQENATVQYHQLVKKHMLSKQRKTETHLVARPMVVSKVFPAGPSIHRVHMPIPRIVS